MKKVRRVLPEHEGGYKIKMPTGSTPRTQQILAKQRERESLCIPKKETLLSCTFFPILSRALMCLVLCSCEQENYSV